MMQIILSSMLLLKHVLSLEQNREEFKIIILLHDGNGCDLNNAANLSHMTTKSISTQLEALCERGNRGQT